MPIYRLVKPTQKNKRFAVVSPEGKITNFGSAVGQTFLDHKDLAKKNAWIARHSKLGENWGYSGRDTAGFWSRWLLWSSDNMEGAIRHLKHKFGIELVK